MNEERRWELGLAGSYEEEAGPAPEEFVFGNEFLAGGAEGVSGRGGWKAFVELGGEIFGEFVVKRPERGEDVLGTGFEKGGNKSVGFVSGADPIKAPVADAEKGEMQL